MEEGRKEGRKFKIEIMSKKVGGMISKELTFNVESEWSSHLMWRTNGSWWYALITPA